MNPELAPVWDAMTKEFEPLLGPHAEWHRMQQAVLAFVRKHKRLPSPLLEPVLGRWYAQQLRDRAAMEYDPIAFAQIAHNSPPPSLAAAEPLCKL
jgi:hypothetical protein